MSSHEETVQFLLAAQQMAQVVAGMQAQVRGRIMELTGLLAQATGNTAVGAEMDQAAAALGSQCDSITGALLSLSEKIGGVIGQLGGS